MPPGKHLNPQRWNDPKKTGQCAHIILSVWGRLQAPVRASQTRRHKRVLSLRVYKAEEMCCLVEKHSLFSHSEIFPNRRLFDSSPHLKPSVNLPTGSFNKSFFFFNRLQFCSGQMRSFYEKRPHHNKLQAFTKPAALPQTRLYCRHGYADMSFIARSWSVSLWEPPAGGRWVRQQSGSSTGRINRRDRARRDICQNHCHISSYHK